MKISCRDSDIKILECLIEFNICSAKDISEVLGEAGSNKIYKKLESFCKFGLARKIEFKILKQKFPKIYEKHVSKYGKKRSRTYYKATQSGIESLESWKRNCKGVS